jgi:tripartite-type tricarboxylate transporter receptor subunit TctC
MPSGLRLIAVGVALFGLVMGDGFAQAYPSRAVSLIVPWPAGGRTDLTARIVASHLRNHIGQPVVVINKPGAGGVLGAKEVAQAAPDGYTLGFFSPSVISTQYTSATPTVLADYVPIAVVNVDPAAIAVKYGAQWKTLAELVEYGRRNHKKLRVGAAVGASTHIFAAGFLKAAGIEAIYVPFKGEADTVAALAGGHIDVQLAVPASYKALAEAHKVRVLGVASETRLPMYGDIPTFKESGVNLVTGAFHAVFAPKGMSPDVLATLTRALEKTMHEKSLIDQMTLADLNILYLNRQETGAYVLQQDALYKVLIQDLGLAASPKKP